MERSQGSREIRQCFAQGFLVNRLVGYCHGVPVPLYEPHFRGFRLDGLQLSKHVSTGGNLDVKTITWFGLTQHHALFVVRYHCHGGIILPQAPVFNLLLSSGDGASFSRGQSERYPHKGQPKIAEKP
jgi:hypothetical protein